MGNQPFIAATRSSATALGFSCCSNHAVAPPVSCACSTRVGLTP